MATLLQKLQTLSTKRVFFGHQSVGNNLILGNPSATDYATVGQKGFIKLFTDNPTGGVSFYSNGQNDGNFADADIDAWSAGQWVELEIGTNGTPSSKVDSFHTLMDRFAARNRLPDYAGFKFCFADFGETFPESEWTHYASVMDSLESTYPGRIIYWTVALTPHPDANEGAGDVVRWEWARRIRERYGYTGRVFDFSARERLDSFNRLMNVADIPGLAWEWADNWDPSWDNVNPVYPAGGLGSHVNNNFANRLTLQYIDFLYNLVTRATMTAAVRTSGVAPLGVFFDAVASTNTGPTAPYTWTPGVTLPADAEGALFSWDFGDPSSGTWTYGRAGCQRNTATGFTAAHIYETPGVYDVLLDVTDVNGSVAYYRQTITVRDFTGTTFYVAQSPTGNDANNGTSTATPFATVGRAMTVALATAGNVRILFRRGDTFAITTSYAITKTDVGIIGAYGSGAKPIFNVSELGDNQAFRIANPAFDWRVMDLEFRGPGTPTHPVACSSVGPSTDYRGENLLIYRLTIVDGWDGQIQVGYNTALGWSYWTNTAGATGTPSRGIIIAENEVGNASGIMIYIGGRQLGVVGNYFHDNAGTTHLLRIWQMHKGVIANNSFSRPGGTRSCIKLHSMESETGFLTTSPDTRYISITDNVFEDKDDLASFPQWALSMGSQSTSLAETSYVSHIVVERNIWNVRAGGNSAIESEAPHVMIRNNVVAMPASVTGEHYGFWIAQRNTAALTTEDIRIYNNTFYRAGSTPEAHPILTWGPDSGGSCTNIRVRNNLWGPVLTNVSLSSGTPIGGWGANGNVQDHNLFTASPGYTNPSGGDFTLVYGSGAVNAGAILPEVTEDFARNLRPSGAAWDIGAYEYTGGVVPGSVAALIDGHGAILAAVSTRRPKTAVVVGTGVITAGTSTSPQRQTSATIFGFGQIALVADRSPFLFKVRFTSPDMAMYTTPTWALSEETTASATIAATGAITLGVRKGARSIGAVIGTGAIVATDVAAVPPKYTTAIVVGTGTLSAAASHRALRTAPVLGTGALGASVYAHTFFHAPAQIVGTGAITAAASKGSLTSVASVAATGSAIVTDRKGARTIVASLATGAPTAAGRKGARSSGTLYGTGITSAALYVQHRAAPVVYGTGVVTATARKGARTTVGTVTATGAIATIDRKGVTRTAPIVAIGVSTAALRKGARSQAAISATGVLSAVQTAWQPMAHSVAMLATGSVAASVARGVSKDLGIAGAGSTAAVWSKGIATGDLTVAGTGFVTTRTRREVPQDTVLEGTAVLTAETFKSSLIDASLAATGSVDLQLTQQTEHGGTLVGTGIVLAAIAKHAEVAATFAATGAISVTEVRQGLWAIPSVEIGTGVGVETVLGKGLGDVSIGTGTGITATLWHLGVLNPRVATGLGARVVLQHKPKINYHFVFDVQDYATTDDFLTALNSYRPRQQFSVKAEPLPRPTAPVVLSADIVDEAA